VATPATPAATGLAGRAAAAPPHGSATWCTRGWIRAHWRAHDRRVLPPGSPSRVAPIGAGRAPRSARVLADRGLSRISVVAELRER